MAKDPHHILLYSHLANSYTLMANCLLDSADRKSAIEYYRKAVTARRTLSEKSPNSGANRSALAECYTNLVKALGPRRRGCAEAVQRAIELLEHLTIADSSNPQYRIALADALTNEARLYVRIAGQDGETSTSLRNWTKAKSLYQRSQEFWVELGKAGKVPTARGEAIREVSSKLARCDDSLMKLQPVH